MPAKPKPDLRITWKTERPSYGGDIETFKGHVVYMTTEPKYEGDTPGLRNPCAWDGPELARLADLTITAQRNTRGDVAESNWYGYAVDYRDVHSVDLRRAETMVKALRAIRRKMDKLDEQFGYAHDLPAFCARVANAIGCLSKSPFGEYHQEITYNGTHYKWTDADGLRYSLDKATAKV